MALVDPRQSRRQFVTTKVAEAALRTAGSEISPALAADLTTHLRGKVNRLVTVARVARVAVAQKDIERAAHAANTMLDLAQGMESARLDNRFRVIANTLRPQDTTNARDVVQRIDMNLAMPI